MIGYRLGRAIDILNVDVEGHDLSVLQSNDWNKYRPKVVLVESLHYELAEVSKDAVFGFLAVLGYRLISKALRTLFFVDRDFRIQLF